MQDSVGKKVISGFRWLVLGRFTAQLVSWAATIMVIRLLSPGSYGLLAMATIFIGLLSMFEEMGMASALIQKEHLDKRTISQVQGIVLLINLTLFGVIEWAAPVIAAFFDEPALVNLVRVLGLQFPLTSLFIVQEALLQRDLAFRGKSMVIFVATVAGALSTLLMAYSGLGVWSLVYGSIITTSVRVVGITIVAGRVIPPIFSFSGMAHVISFGGFVTLDRLLWFFYSRADALIIGKLLGAELLGFYSVAIHLATLPMQKVAGIVNEVSFSGFSRIQADLAEVRHQFLKGVQLVGFFAFAVFFGISAVSPEIVLIFLGEKWVTAITPLQILSLVVPLRMLATMLPSSLMGLGRADVSAGNGILACIILPVTFWIGVRWGLAGVSYAWLVGYPIYFFIALRRSLPVLGTNIREYFTSIWVFAFGAICMYGAVAAARYYLEYLNFDPLAKLIIMVFLGGSAYIVATSLLRPKTVRVALRVVTKEVA